MKTAKEITEYLQGIQNEEMSPIQFAIYRSPESYLRPSAMYKTLVKIREVMMEYEYFDNEDRRLEGIEDALKWVLE